MIAFLHLAGKAQQSVETYRTVRQNASLRSKKRGHFCNFPS